MKSILLIFILISVSANAQLFDCYRKDRPTDIFKILLNDDQANSKVLMFFSSKGVNWRAKLSLDVYEDEADDIKRTVIYRKDDSLLKIVIFNNPILDMGNDPRYFYSKGEISLSVNNDILVSSNNLICSRFDL